MPENKANIGAIFGTALVGVAEDLIEAKNKGQQLPGMLDKLATLASNAKNKGVDIARDVAKNKLKEYIPHIVAGVAIVIIIVLVVRKPNT